MFDWLFEWIFEAVLSAIIHFVKMVVHAIANFILEVVADFAHNTFLDHIGSALFHFGTTIVNSLHIILPGHTRITTLDSLQNIATDHTQSTIVDPSQTTGPTENVDIAALTWHDEMLYAQGAIHRATTPPIPNSEHIQGDALHHIKSDTSTPLKQGTSRVSPTPTPSGSPSGHSPSGGSSSSGSSPTFGVAEDIIVVVASMATIVQTLIVIRERWEKTHNENKASLPSPLSTEFQSITLMMSDGTRTSFQEWLTDPNKFKRYIDSFILPSNSPKPVQVLLVLTNNTKVRVDVSKGAQGNVQLNEVLSYLKMAPNSSNVSLLPELHSNPPSSI